MTVEKIGNYIDKRIDTYEKISNRNKISRLRSRMLDVFILELKQIKNMINKLDVATEWVSVNTRLPDETDEHTNTSDDVLVCFSDERVTKGYYSYVSNRWIYFGSKGEIVAWKPLPKPYKESKE